MNQEPSLTERRYRKAKGLVFGKVSSLIGRHRTLDAIFPLLQVEEAKVESDNDAWAVKR